MSPRAETYIVLDLYPVATPKSLKKKKKKQSNLEVRWIVESLFDFNFAQL